MREAIFDVLLGTRRLDEEKRSRRRQKILTYNFWLYGHIFGTPYDII